MLPHGSFVFIRLLQYFVLKIEFVRYPNIPFHQFQRSHLHLMIIEMYLKQVPILRIFYRFVDTREASKEFFFFHLTEFVRLASRS